MVTEEEKQEQETEPKAADDPCAGCGDESFGCSGCGSGKRRVDPWWFIIAVLAVVVVALLIAKFKSGST